ncbi:hypothetical protein ACQ856_01170 [Mycolicibacterium psychrotolerans]|uniref:hypothetical protein n=1 Tax=Mycolicibacterium psychrotolerans TaxID=216929 RepID=UPI003D67B1FD
MEHAARRPMIAFATLTTAGALALAPITVAPPEMHALNLSPATVTTQAVQLTDAWSDLAANTVTSVVQLGGLFIGTDATYPLPSPTIPLAPVATQLVLNQLIYVAQLFTGDFAKIPAEIGAHLSGLGSVASILFTALPTVFVQQIQTQFFALQQAIESVAVSTNKLAALVEAPAVFLNIALNSEAGLLGRYGPIGIPLIIRNLLAEAIYTPPPTIVLPFKKPAAATATPKTAAAAADAPKSGTAGSARSKPKAPATSSKKASPAKSATSAKSGGAGHSKRG